MSGGGNRHRAPIDVGDLDLKAKTPGALVRKREDLVPADAKPQHFGETGEMRVAAVHHVVTAFLVVMIIGVGLWTYLAFRSADIIAPDGATLTKAPFESASSEAQVDRLHFALRVYFRLYEKYPPTLEELVAEGLLTASDLQYPLGEATIAYERSGDTYQLTLERELPAAAQPTVPEGEADAEAPSADAGAAENSEKAKD